MRYSQDIVKTSVWCKISLAKYSFCNFSCFFKCKKGCSIFIRENSDSRWKLTWWSNPISLLLVSPLPFMLLMWWSLRFVSFGRFCVKLRLKCLGDLTECCFEQISRLACHLGEATAQFVNKRSGELRVRFHAGARSAKTHEWLRPFPRETAFVWVWRKWDGGRGDGGGKAHLRKWPCTQMCRPQPVTCRDWMVCVFHSLGFTRSLRVCLS